MTPSEMVRVAGMSDDDRQLVNGLTPDERLTALREAGQRKASDLIKRSYQDTLRAIARGELAPRTDYVTYLSAGDIVCMGAANDRYEWLGVVPGFEGAHILRPEAGGKMFTIGGSQVRRPNEAWVPPLGDDDD